MRNSSASAPDLLAAYDAQIRTRPIFERLGFSALTTTTPFIRRG
jgi:hypothetical protein